MDRGGMNYSSRLRHSSHLHHIRCGTREKNGEWKKIPNQNKTVTLHGKKVHILHRLNDVVERTFCGFTFVNVLTLVVSFHLGTCRGGFKIQALGLRLKPQSSLCLNALKCVMCVYSFFLFFLFILRRRRAHSFCSHSIYPSHSAASLACVRSQWM